jgi:hypothetical protein
MQFAQAMKNEYIVSAISRWLDMCVKIASQAGISFYTLSE